MIPAIRLRGIHKHYGPVYHATGVRVRKLPIRLENLLGASV